MCSRTMGAATSAVQPASFFANEHRRTGLFGNSMRSPLPEMAAICTGFSTPQLPAFCKLAGTVNSTPRVRNSSRQACAPSGGGRTFTGPGSEGFSDRAGGVFPTVLTGGAMTGLATGLIGGGFTDGGDSTVVCSISFSIRGFGTGLTGAFLEAALSGEAALTAVFFGACLRGARFRAGRAFTGPISASRSFRVSGFFRAAASAGSIHNPATPSAIASTANICRIMLPCLRIFALES